MKKLDEEYEAKVKKLAEEHGIKEQDVTEQWGWPKRFARDVGNFWWGVGKNVGSWFG